MQETRQHILDILKAREEATVDDIVDDLQKRRGKITPVTVRHHLKLLHQDGLIINSELRRRSSPGRPQYVYKLTDKALGLFPNNYQRLAKGLLDSIRQLLPPSDVNVLIEGVANQFALEVYIPDVRFNQRLDIVVDYLSDSGYDAHWESAENGYYLHTANCPYHDIVEDNTLLCDVDMKLIAVLLGVVPRRIAHMLCGDARCSYWIPMQVDPEKA